MTRFDNSVLPMVRAAAIPQADRRLQKAQPTVAAVSSSEIEDHSVTFNPKTDLRQVILGIQHPDWRNHPPIPSHGERATPTVDELARAEVPIFREDVVEFHLCGIRHLHPVRAQPPAVSAPVRMTKANSAPSASLGWIRG